MREDFGKAGRGRGGSPWVGFLAGLILCAVIVGGWIRWRPHPPSAQPGVGPTGSRGTAELPQPARRASPPVSTRSPSATDSRPPVERTTLSAPPSAGASALRLPATGRLDTTNLVATSELDYPRAVQTVFEAQVALARRALSPGSLDGLMGGQTRAAIRAFQVREKLPPTGELDDATRAALLLTTHPLTNYVVTAADLERLQPLSGTWLGKSQQSALEYETILELVAERSWSSPRLIRKLNPAIDWARVPAGLSVVVPSVEFPPPPEPAAFVRIQLSARTLEVFGGETNLLVHFPCSIAQQVEKRPVGEVGVIVVVPHPDYTFNPELFPDAPEARDPGHKLRIPPGPNNPVGVAWIGLGLPGYGIHGTPKPEDIGRTESRGCFRLANWNAEYLLKLVRVGTPVFVDP